MLQSKIGIDDGDWDHLLGLVEAGYCLPFLGAGASMGYENVGLPTAGELAERLALEFDYPGIDKRDFLRVCQYVELSKDPLTLRIKIRNALNIEGREPSRLHRSIAALPFRYVLTTNYDDLIERAFSAELPKTPKVEVHYYRGDKKVVPTGTIEAPVIYKLHGALDDIKTMVCSKDDVVQFLAGLLTGQPALPDAITKLFSEQSLLFIGYGLKDWNIRVMLRAMRGDGKWAKSFAIQMRPVEPMLASDWESSVIYWDKRENVTCFNMDALEFVEELARRYRQRKEGARHEADG